MRKYSKDRYEAAHDQGVLNLSRTFDLGSVANSLAAVRNNEKVLSYKEIRILGDDLVRLREAWNFSPEQMMAALILREPQLAEEWRYQIPGYAEEMI